MLSSGPLLTLGMPASGQLAEVGSPVGGAGRRLQHRTPSLPARLADAVCLRLDLHPATGLRRAMRQAQCQSLSLH